MTGMQAKGMVGMQEMKQAPAGGRAVWTWIGGVAAGVAVGALVWFFAIRGGSDRPVPAEPTAEPTATTAPAAPDQSSAEAPTVAAPVLPSFDTVRAEADGSVLVAGTAGAAAKVHVLVDGAEAGSSDADGQGKFAAFLDLGVSDKPRVITLMVKGSDGSDLTSATNVILAPTPAPGPADTTTETAAAAAPAETADAEASANPDVLVADAEGVTKQTPDAPLAEMIIDTIGYDAFGNVDIAGRGAAGTFAWLYIDNELAASAPLSLTGKWRMKLTGIDAGVHTLRVDQLDDAGKVTSRVETPFQREATEKVATAAPAVAAAPEPAAAMPPPVQDVTITVQPGFTLWAIARETYGDGMLYVRVFQANKDQIRDPDLIYPGQVFSVPQD